MKKDIRLSCFCSKAALDVAKESRRMADDIPSDDVLDRVEAEPLRKHLTLIKLTLEKAAEYLETSVREQEKTDEGEG